jgi:protein kinase C substrate 80K-H
MLTLLLLIQSTLASALDAKPLDPSQIRGLHPQSTSGTMLSLPNLTNVEYGQYSPQNGNFTCLDRSRTIPFSSINDNYCDCQDGSDEPGTSACAKGSFWCKNEGHIGGWVLSSRVGDGICGELQYPRMQRVWMADV